MALRILIADDDPTIRLLIRRFLEAHPGWQVCAEAVNGLEAVHQVEQVSPDVAILDLGMPLMNGMEAARRISESNPTLPMLLISVQEVSEALVSAARHAGFRGAITKSRGAEVVQGVEALIERRLFFQSGDSSSVSP
jgi:DNA-binding NarL/FixJ family response regulator